MKYIVFVLFWSPDGFVEMDGFGPRYAPDMQTCIERRDTLHSYVKDTGLRSSFVTTCHELGGEE